MLGKILFATDFSECCLENGIAFLERIREVVEEVVVVHVVDEKEITTIVTNIVWLGETTEEYEEELRKKLREKAENEMRKLKEDLEKRGFKVKTVITEGHPAEEIVKIAESEDVSLIVVGSHGKSNLKSVLIGSVSEDVVRRATRPVTVVRREVSL